MVRRRARNRQVRSAVRSALKSARVAIAEGDAEAAGSTTRQAESLLRRAVSKGVVHWKHASRQISRLAKAANQVS
jgi:small subunit ribosomal protein S20